MSRAPIIAARILIALALVLACNLSDGTWPIAGAVLGALWIALEQVRHDQEMVAERCS